MKTLTLVTAIAITATLSLPAHADTQRANDARHVSTILTSTIAGAVVGGPVGAFLGAIGGAFMSAKNQKTYDEKIALNADVDQLEQAVDERDVAINNLEGRVAKKLEFQVMFPTGNDTLAFQDLQRIKSLTKYLSNNPQLRVRLDGHADPRGTDEYNNVLSAERAKAVADAMVEYGISAERIDIHSHGSSLATAVNGNYDQLAMERRVHIEVFSESSDIASNP